MRFSTQVLTGVLAFASSAWATPVAASNDVVERDEPFPADAGRSVATPLLRSYNGAVTDHFYTIDAPESTAYATNGYTYEGIQAYVLRYQQFGSIPVYRSYCQDATDHFYTQTKAEHDLPVNGFGCVEQGIAFFCYDYQAAGTTLLLRAYSAGGTNHFYTTSRAELDNAVNYLGYVEEAPVCYVFSS